MALVLEGSEPVARHVLVEVGNAYASLSGSSEPFPGDSLTSLRPPRAPVLSGPRATGLHVLWAGRALQHGVTARGGLQDGGTRVDPRSLVSRKPAPGPGTPGMALSTATR